MIQCPYCHHIMSLFHFDTHRANECVYCIVECPNHDLGCVVRCERQLMESHLQHCNFQLFECPFTTFGCKYTNANGKQLESNLKQHCNHPETKINHLQLKIEYLENELKENSNNKNDGNENETKARNQSNRRITHNRNDTESKSNFNLSKRSIFSENKLLFAWIGSEKGKHSDRHCIECIDVHTGFVCIFFKFFVWFFFVSKCCWFCARIKLIFFFTCLFAFGLH